MKVYILVAHEQRIEGVYLNKKDAQDMIDSFKGDEKYTKLFSIEEHEVIE